MMWGHVKGFPLQQRRDQYQQQIPSRNTSTVNVRMRCQFLRTKTRGLFLDFEQLSTIRELSILQTTDASVYTNRSHHTPNWNATCFGWRDICFFSSGKNFHFIMRCLLLSPRTYNPQLIGKGQVVTVLPVSFCSTCFPFSLFLLSFLSSSCCSNSLEVSVQILW